MSGWTWSVRGGRPTSCSTPASKRSSGRSGRSCAVSSSSGPATVQDKKQGADEPGPAGSAGRSRRGGGVDATVWVGRLAVLVFILVVWYLAVELGWVLDLYAATPVETFQRL